MKSQAVDFCVCTFRPAVLKGSVCRENISLLLSLQHIQGFLNHRRKALQEISPEYEMNNNNNNKVKSSIEFSVVEESSWRQLVSEPAAVANSSFSVLRGAAPSAPAACSFADNIITPWQSLDVNAAV